MYQLYYKNYMNYNSSKQFCNVWNVIFASCFVEFTTDYQIPLCCFWSYFLYARQKAIVKQTIHCCYFYKMILLFWRQLLKSGTTLFLMMPITCIVKFAKWIVCHTRPCCQSSNSFWPFLQDNFVFFTEVAKIWNFTWVMPTYKLTQEFRSLLNIDNHTRPYDQYLANRMKALTNKTEDCLSIISWW